MGYPNRQSELLLASAEQSREADRRTIEELGLTGDTLMEIAGLGAAAYISSRFTSDRPLLFVCGKGNNAGDAFVCARSLMNDGYDITLFPVFGTDNLSDNADRNLKRLLRLSQEMNTEITIWDQWQNTSSFGLIIDGLFGTGLRSDVRSPVSEIIEQINQSGRRVCALDIPSGLNCNTGNIHGTCVQADTTLQFGLQKLGCYLENGPVYSGVKELIPLPFPDIYKKDISIRLVDEARDPMNLLIHTHRESEPSVSSDTAHWGSESDIPNKTSRHKSSLHKYNNGVVHVIGGSAGLTGAPLYTARAAWSLGMGAVSLIHPSAWSVAMAAQAPELIKKPIGATDSVYFTKQHVKEVLTFLNEKPGITVIGPGIGREKKTAEFVRVIIRESDSPVIIDADGLRCIVGHEEVITRRKHPEQVILTPHPGELTQLTQTKPVDDSERLRQTMALSERLGCTILAKGNPVLVHTPGKSETLLTGYDTSHFARAGFGDILAGHIASFFSRTNNPHWACEAGLLFGYQKIADTLSGGTRFPEPSDLI